LIFVTVGGVRPFERLVTEMDHIAGRLAEKVVMQIGTTSYEPKNCDYLRFMPRNDIEELYASARVVVCHAGIGSILAAMQHNRPLILVPRMKRYGEHIDDHQLEIARAMENRGVMIVYDISNLASAVEDGNMRPIQVKGETNLVRMLKEYLAQMTK
jgi:beta-1,4-N-acetylglucosaminyltransferase